MFWRAPEHAIGELNHQQSGELPDATWMTCIRSIRWLSGQIASISQSGVQNLGIFLRCQTLKSQPLFHFFISSTFIFWYWYNMYQGSQKYILQYLLTDEAYNNSRLFLLASDSELGASATRISRTLLMRPQSLRTRKGSAPQQNRWLIDPPCFTCRNLGKKFECMTSAYKYSTVKKEKERKGGRQPEGGSTTSSKGTKSFKGIHTNIRAEKWYKGIQGPQILRDLVYLSLRGSEKLQ